MRDPRRARRRLARPGALAVVREAAAGARRDRGAAQSSTATGAGAGVQDPRTPDAQETQEALIAPRVRDDAVELAYPDPEQRHREVALWQEVLRPRPGPPFRRDGGV